MVNIIWSLGRSVHSCSKITIFRVKDRDQDHDLNLRPLLGKLTVTSVTNCSDFAKNLITTFFTWNTGPLNHNIPQHLAALDQRFEQQILAKHGHSFGRGTLEHLDYSSVDRSLPKKATAPNLDF